MADLLTTTDYTFGYSRLRTYTNELGDPTFKARVSAATDRFKPILHSCLSQYSDDQNIQAEVQFVSFVRQWQSLSDALPVPALVWRRTGDINGGNTRMARLLDVPLDNLRSGKLCIYHVSHQDAVQMSQPSPHRPRLADDFPDLGLGFLPGLLGGLCVKGVDQLG